MLDLLESCFEEQEDRPADASVIADRLGEILKQSGGGGREIVASSAQPTPEPPPAPVRKKASKPSVGAKKRKATPIEPNRDVASEPPAEVVNSIGMKLRLIPAGKSMMGLRRSDKDAFDDERPQHPVRITRPYYLGVYQVTWNDYLNTIESDTRNITGGGNHPVADVTWFDAVRFCNARSRAEGLTLFYVVNGQSVEVPDWGGSGYRLPTEAEWEYACRAGTTTSYSFGDNEGGRMLGRFAWYNSNSDGRTHPVGEKKPNAFGLFDMHGNVWEWCWDWFDSEYYRQSPESDPRGPNRTDSKVCRGGGWGSGQRPMRSANRIRNQPDYHASDLGFRVARNEATG